MEEKAKTLREVLPPEFKAEFMYTNPRNYNPENVLSPAAKLLDVKVVKEHSPIHSGEYKAWPGKQKNVCCWWELENGMAVAWNENVASGWSFPVVKL
jgi:hypothetical protein